MNANDAREAVQRIESRFLKNAPRRFISGVAVSRTFRDAKGNEFDPRGAIALDAALPLTIQHDLMHTIGVVRSIEARGDQLHFQAEVANDDGPYWVAQAWRGIASPDFSWKHVSITGKDIGPAFGRTYSRWVMFELAVCAEGLDYGAQISKVWERDHVVRLNEPSIRTLWHAVRVAR